MFKQQLQKRCGIWHPFTFNEDKINIFGKKVKIYFTSPAITVANSKVNSVMKIYLSQVLYFFAVMYKIYPIQKNIKLL